MKSERQENILEILKEKRFATVEFLAKTLYSSAPTIRRDLNEMEEKGFVKRSHGGAMIADTENSPIPIDFRNRKNIYEKIGICKKAAQLIKENSVIFIDGSTTTLHLADCVPGDKNITVVTNSLLICARLCERNITTHCTGGILVPSSKAFVGQRAENVIRDFCFDACFFSASALDERGKITDYSDMETSLRKVMLENSKTKVFMCDHSKFAKTSSYNVTDLDNVDYLITDVAFDTGIFRVKNL